MLRISVVVITVGVSYDANVKRASELLLAIARDLTPAEHSALTTQLEQLVRETDVWLGLPPDHGFTSAVPGVRTFERFEDLDIALTQRGVDA